MRLHLIKTWIILFNFCDKEYEHIFLNRRDTVILWHCTKESIVFRAIHYFPVLSRIIWFRDKSPFVQRLFESYVYEQNVLPLSSLPLFPPLIFYRFLCESVSRARKDLIEKKRKIASSFFALRNAPVTSENRCEKSVDFYESILPWTQNSIATTRQMDFHLVNRLRISRKFSLSVKWHSHGLYICQASRLC